MCASLVVLFSVKYPAATQRRGRCFPHPHPLLSQRAVEAFPSETQSPSLANATFFASTWTTTTTTTTWVPAHPSSSSKSVPKRVETHRFCRHRKVSRSPFWGRTTTRKKVAATTTQKMAVVVVVVQNTLDDDDDDDFLLLFPTLSPSVVPKALRLSSSMSRTQKIVSVKCPHKRVTHRYV